MHNRRVRTTARERFWRSLWISMVVRDAAANSRRLARATRMSERQAMARARAADLGLERWEGTAVAAVEERLSVADAEVRAAEDEARVADERRISERAAGEATVDG